MNRVPPARRGGSCGGAALSPTPLLLQKTRGYAPIIRTFMGLVAADMTTCIRVAVARAEAPRVARAWTCRSEDQDLCCRAPFGSSDPDHANLSG